MDMAQTEKGRYDLGIKPEDYEEQKLFGNLINRNQALTVGKTRVVKGFRQMWASLSGPQDKIDESFEEGRTELLQGITSTPIVANIFESLSAEAEIEVNVLRAQATDILYRGLLRALQGSEIPKSIKTDDLISPLDGKPIRYQFDGKQITLDAGKGHGTQLIQNFPPGPPVP